jgi:hypothetical protein
MTMASPEAKLLFTWFIINLLQELTEQAAAKGKIAYLFGPAIQS